MFFRALVPLFSCERKSDGRDSEKAGNMATPGLGNVDVSISIHLALGVCVYVTEISLPRAGSSNPSLTRFILNPN